MRSDALRYQPPSFGQLRGHASFHHALNAATIKLTPPESIAPRATSTPPGHEAARDASRR